jgi:hypothetical protein
MPEAGVPWSLDPLFSWSLGPFVPVSYNFFPGVVSTSVTLRAEIPSNQIGSSV